ncbi:MAG: arsenate reductase ArsC [Rhizomicrobium sp.]
MSIRIYNILFLCRHNSARSIIAEAYVNSRKIAHLRAYSGGEAPLGHIHPMALEVLKEAGIPTDNLRSKSWDEFARPGAPVMDLIINLCDEPAKEQCPTWPGKPVTAHWAIPDPAAVEGSDIFKRAAFANVLAYIKQRTDFLQHFSAEQLENLAKHSRENAGKSTG